MDQWALIHRYNRLVNEGLAQPLVCPDCGTRVIPMLGVDDSLILWCQTDDKMFKPGLAFFSDIRAVVTEFYLE